MLLVSGRLEQVKVNPRNSSANRRHGTCLLSESPRTECCPPHLPRLGLPASMRLRHPTPGHSFRRYRALQLALVLTILLFESRSQRDSVLQSVLLTHVSVEQLSTHLELMDSVVENPPGVICDTVLWTTWSRDRLQPLKFHQDSSQHRSPDQMVSVQMECRWCRGNTVDVWCGTSHVLTRWRKVIWIVPWRDRELWQPTPSLENALSMKSSARLTVSCR